MTTEGRAGSQATKDSVPTPQMPADTRRYVYGPLTKLGGTSNDLLQEVLLDNGVVIGRVARRAGTWLFEREIFEPVRSNEAAQGKKPRLIEPPLVTITRNEMIEFLHHFDECDKKEPIATGS